MPDKFQNKYRNGSIRLQNWDYRWNAAYFVTICTKNRECYFGDIVDGEMKLSPIGNIVKTEWLKTFDMRPDMNLTMGEYVIMPNHFHAIIGIGKNKYNTVVGTQCIAYLPPTKQSSTSSNETNKPKNQFGPQRKNLASIIRGFKIGVTTNVRKIHTDFAWQSRFYEHIIRDTKSYERIKNYIIKNPANWKNDKFKHIN